MPYAPGISYHGDQYIFQGITQAAQSFAEALKKKEEQDKQLAFNDAIVNHALQSGRITLDDFNKYRDMSGTKKIGFANGLAANIADEFAWAQAAQKLAIENAHLGIAQQRLGLERAAQGFVPPAEAFEAARHTGGELLPTSPGHYTYQEYPDAPGTGGSSGVPDILPPLVQQQANQAGVVPLPTGPNSFTYKELPETTGASVPSDPSKWKQITLPGTNIQVVVDDKGGIIPNSKLQGALHPTGTIQTMEYMGVKPKGAGGTLTAKDQEALDWARQNPTDPRAAAILKRLGLLQ